MVRSPRTVPDTVRSISAAAGRRPLSIPSITGSTRPDSAVTTSSVILTILEAKGGQRKSSLLLVTSISVPMITLMVLSGISIQLNAEKQMNANSVSVHLSTGSRIVALATELQRERGMSCVWLNTETRGKGEVKAKLSQFRTSTSKTLHSVINLNMDPPVMDFRLLTYRLENHRGFVTRRKVSCPQNLRFYTSVNLQLLFKMRSLRSSSGSAQFWYHYTAYQLLIHAEDSLDIVLSLGSTYYLNGGLDRGDMLTLKENQAIGELMTKVAVVSSSVAKERMRILESRHGTLFGRLAEQRQEMRIANLSKPDPIRELEWFRNMDIYIDLLSDVDKRVLKHLQLSLDSDKVTKKRSVIITTITTVISICLPLIAYYGYNGSQLLVKFRRTMLMLKTKTTELNEAKRMSEGLLHQVIPPSVALQLMASRTVDPELYEASTVFFSDIVGFSDIATSSTPGETIRLLNKLYSQFDDIIDSHDVYKVETIGASYMVVSGIPNKNGRRHIVEISNLALDLLEAMTSFYIPHLPHQRLLIRIGYHSGSCCAGIVGVKMPRFCLFGDTVNTASRMQSTGMPSRAQLSSDAFNLLNSFGNYICIHRGSIEVKGKGMVKTYWLMGRKDLKFQVTLDQSIDPHADAETTDLTYGEQNVVI